MDVPRELVAQQDQRQRAVGGVGPVIECTAGGPLEQTAKLLFDLGVELGRALPPELARLAVAGIGERQQPEVENGTDCLAVAHGISFLP
jgi:hypothetical protein